VNDEKTDKIISLLEQIRNLQQQGLENSLRAIRNQEESIAVQKMAVGRFRKYLFPVLMTAIVLVLIVIFFLLRILLRYRIF
jgi:hypothetical protein